MADRFYVNFPLAPGLAVLQGAEAHHLATVMRARPGDAVCLFNGDGAEYPAVVADVAKRVVSVTVGEPVRPPRELPFALEVAAPLPKGDRGDFLVEKLTELGVASFTPLRTRRSVVHPRTDRLERAVIEASKQCGRNRLMAIGPVTDWAVYCEAAGVCENRVLAHRGGPPAATLASSLCGQAGSLSYGVALAIGPEGGFTDDEVGLGRAAGWTVVDLGQRTLRVETAAVALAAYFGLSS